jgi:acyl transferase domain-containing protein
MFSGQGSQSYHMGGELFANDATFRKCILSLDVICRDVLKRSVVERIYDESKRAGDRFDDGVITHPAIFMVEMATTEVLMERGVNPDAVIGVSLGSFAAAVVAGCMTVEQAMQAVLRQAAVIEEHCPPGGMLAVLGDVERHRQELLGEQYEVVSADMSSHFVVAAPHDVLERLEGRLMRKSIPVQRLPVRRAYHSKWIDAARAPLLSSLQSLSTRVPTIPFACCASSDLLAQLPADYFWAVVRAPIRFAGAIASLERTGSFRYVDAGPLGSLAGLLSYVLPPESRSVARTVLSPFRPRDVRERIAALARES